MIVLFEYGTLKYFDLQHIFFVWESLAPVESAGDWLVCTFISNTNETPSVDVEKNDDLIFGSPDLEMMEVNVSKEFICV